MSDDLTKLRLDVARALNVPMYYEEECDGERYYYYAEGERIHKPLPDYPADLGACQELLDAIAARGWDCSLHWDGRTWEAWLSEPTLDGKALGHGEARQISEALCRAFVQAVEASSIPSTG